MDRFETIRQRRRAAADRLTALGSPTWAAFLELERVTYADRALPRRAKELIAVGISVVIDCESCMQWHVEQAVAEGAGFAEVLEAIEVGIEMGGGPATVSARFALRVLDGLFPDQK